MATTVWKGHLTFGMVSIPVRLFRAARPEKVKLHQLHRRSAPEPRPVFTMPERPAKGSATQAPAPVLTESRPIAEAAPVTRIRQTVVDPIENAPIPRSELVRGYEYDEGQYAVIDEEEIRKITPQTATEMQIVEFVRFADIDPVYLETSYYMAPDEAGEKAYSLLFEGLRQTGYVALAQVAMHRREHVMILRPGKRGIITHTMFYPDEVRTIQEFRTDASLVNEKELGLAKMLIETLAAPFDPAKFKDTYRERLQALIEGQVKAQELVPAVTGAPQKVIDITEALRKSLEAATAQAPRKAVKSERPAAKKRQRGAR